MYIDEDDWKIGSNLGASSDKTPASDAKAVLSLRVKAMFKLRST